MDVIKNEFGTIEGQSVDCYTILTDDMKFSFINYGAALQRIEMPDKKGNINNIVIGFDNVEDYRESGTYAGMSIGRVGGRIADAKFQLNDQTFSLEANLDGHHLHGGSNGLSFKLFDVEVLENANGEEIALKMITELKSEDDGYPGNMKVQITHTINNDNSWTVHYFAETDEETLFNPTNHTYFNLNGGTDDVSDHELMLGSHCQVETGEDLIPTGHLIDKSGEEDFRQLRPLTSDFDNAYRLMGNPDAKRIELLHKKTGRKVEIKTDTTYVVVYTADGLDYTTKSGHHFGSRAGVALETQRIPDAIHHPQLDDIRVMPEETFQSETTYYFSVE